MITSVLDDIRTEIKRAVSLMGVEVGDTDIVLESSKEKAHGDYATNIAMRLARTLHRPPHDIANDICAKLDCQSMHIAKVEVAGAGFINLFLDNAYLLSVVWTILAARDHYGDSDTVKPGKINLEFVSANPTGALHVGHGRGAAYGDSLARIYRKAGYQVDCEHYVNDAGNQINNMALSVYERYKELFGLPIVMQEDYYMGPEIITIAKKIKAEYEDQYLDHYDAEFFKNYGTEQLLAGLKHDLATFRVHFDTWFSEKSLYKQGLVQKTLDLLEKQNYTYTQEGALWLKTSLYNDEKDRVIIKSDGNYTYVLPDIAYHANKLDRGYTHLIDVLGADHHGYIDRLKAAVTMVGGNSNLIDVEMLQMVRVIENGEEVKMSKRSGKAITLIDLIDSVGVDALRYFYVSKALGTHMDLDLDLMRKKTNDNPVYYAQYAYARIASLFRNLVQKDLSYQPTTDFSALDMERTKELCLLLLRYPQTIEDVASSRLVHKLTHYIGELASALHSYYNDEKILSDNPAETMAKLTILEAVAIVLKNALSLIGVEAPEKM